MLGQLSQAGKGMPASSRPAVIAEGGSHAIADTLFQF